MQNVHKHTLCIESPKGDRDEVLIVNRITIFLTVSKEEGCLVITLVGIGRNLLWTSVYESLAWNTRCV
jgi:hypothetical protein